MKSLFFKKNVIDNFTSLIKKNSNIDNIIVKKYTIFDPTIKNLFEKLDINNMNLNHLFVAYMNKLKLKDFIVFELIHNGYNFPYKTTLISIETNSKTLIFPIMFNTKFLDFFIFPIDLGYHRRYDDWIYSHHYIYSPFDPNYGKSIYYEIYGEFNFINSQIVHYKSDQNCFNKDILYLSAKTKTFPKKENNLTYTLIHKNKIIKEKFIEIDSFNEKLIFDGFSKILFPYNLSDKDLEIIGLERPDLSNINDNYEKFYELYMMLNI